MERRQLGFLQRIGHGKLSANPRNPEALLHTAMNAAIATGLRKRLWQNHHCFVTRSKYMDWRGPTSVLIVRKDATLVHEHKDLWLGIRKCVDINYRGQVIRTTGTMRSALRRTKRRVNAAERIVIRPGDGNADGSESQRRLTQAGGSTETQNRRDIRCH